MFLDHFKFAEQPFGATPDPRFLFPSASHREALASLYCGYVANRGFTALIADPGMGKTTLLFEFLHQIKDRARTAFLFNTLCDSRDLLSGVLRDLGVEPSRRTSDWYSQLNALLASEARAGRHVVLVVDEAQNLSIGALEVIRLLTNFETPTKKLLQIVLAGQPQLANTLADPAVAQLLQRISTFCRIAPFSAAEVGAYIQHRLKVAGYSGRDLFTSDAVELIAQVSRGTPRIINTLCFNALCLCRAKNSKLVDTLTLAEVVADLQVHSEVSAPVTHQLSVVPSAAQAEIAPANSSRRKRTLSYAAAVLFGMCIAITGAGIWNTLYSGRARVPAVDAAERRVQSNVSAGNGQLNENQASQPARNILATDQATPGVNSKIKDGSDNPMEVTIDRGDTLEDIATRRLGRWDSTVMREIRTLNPNMRDPNRIKSGSVILLPTSTQLDSGSASRRTQ